MDGLLQDLRLAWRGIRAKPGFSAVVIITLALGIGVNTAVFSLANWVMLRPVPGVRDPGRLVTVRIQSRSGGQGGTSYPNLRDLKERATALSGLAGESGDFDTPIQVGSAKPTIERALYVSRDYFDILGVHLQAGRTFTADEETDVWTQGIVVVSHQFWATALHRDPTVIGNFIKVGGRPARIVGVTPIGFQGSDLLGGVDLWLPGSALRMTLGVTSKRNHGVFLYLRGRLAPGASIATAESQLNSEFARLVSEYPDDNRSWLSYQAVISEGIGIRPDAKPLVQRTLMIIAGIGLLVLLVACANVANLYLFRGVSRRQVVAVRRALGASTGRLARAELIESTVTAALGGVVALAATWWALSLFRGRLFSTLRHGVTAEIDWRAFAFALAATLVTGAVAGLAPAWATARLDVIAALKTGAGRHSGDHNRMHGPLAVLQLSVALAVVVTTLLLVATVRNLQRVDVGFDADKVIVVGISPSLTGHLEGDGQRILRGTLDRVRALPGVEHAAISGYTPFTYSLATRVHRAEADSTTGIWVTRASATPDYFQTMGIRLLRGRTFDDAEEFARPADSAGVVVLSETLAQRLFGAADPVGRIVVESFSQPARVIGVVADSRWASLSDEGAGPLEYAPMKSDPYGFLLVRTSLPVGRVQHAVEDIVAALAPDTPLGDAALLRDNVRSRFAEQTLLARLLAAFGSIAVALAAVGLYGVVSFSVAQRTREIGIRMALGARIEQVTTMVLGQGARLGIAGAVLGLAGAAALARVVRSQLFGVRAGAPLVYLLASLTLGVIVLAATWIPARRAAKVDPAITLRAE